MDRPTLTNREIALEKLKGISNAKFDYIERLHDRHPVCELYARGEIELHIHYAMDGVFCATYRAFKPGEGRMAAEKANPSEGPFYSGELPVFIPVGEVLKDFCPLASLVWLKDLNLCDVCGVDALEPGLFASRETRWTVFNGKLRHLLGSAGIEPSKVINKEINGASEVIADLSDQHPDAQRGQREILWGTHFEFMRRIRVELTDHSVFLTPFQTDDLPMKISKVFLCPTDPFKGWIE